MRNGADPELRDEDGKTPADKARERHDEGHREVLEILQSPSKYSAPHGRRVVESGRVEMFGLHLHYDQPIRRS